MLIRIVLGPVVLQAHTIFQNFVVTGDDDDGQTLPVEPIRAVPAPLDTTAHAVVQSDVAQEVRCAHGDRDLVGVGVADISLQDDKIVPVRAVLRVISRPDRVRFRGSMAL